MLEPIVKPVSEMTRDDVLHNLRVVLEMMEDGRIDDDHFDMSEVHSHCGTIHCIRGWLAEVSGHGHRVVNLYMVLADAPRPCADRELFKMFYEWAPSEKMWWDIKTSDAIIVIKHYLETGVTDWTLAKEVA